MKTRFASLFLTVRRRQHRTLKNKNEFQNKKFDWEFFFSNTLKLFNRLRSLILATTGVSYIYIYIYICLISINNNNKKSTFSFLPFSLFVQPKTYIYFSIKKPTFSSSHDTYSAYASFLVQSFKLKRQSLFSHKHKHIDYIESRYIIVLFCFCT